MLGHSDYVGIQASLVASDTLAETKTRHFKIGIILGLTGPLSSWCEASQHAAELAKGLRSGDAIGFLRGLKDYPGASGVFSATGDGRFTLPATLKMVKGDEFVEVRSFSPNVSN